MWGFEFADITSKPECRGGSSVPRPTVPRLGPSQLVERISREVFYVCSFLEHIAQCDTGMLTYIVLLRRAPIRTPDPLVSKCARWPEPDHVFTSPHDPSDGVVVSSLTHL